MRLKNYVIPSVFLFNYILRIGKTMRFKWLFSIFKEEEENFIEFLLAIENSPGKIPVDVEREEYFYFPTMEGFHNCVGKFRVKKLGNGRYRLRDLYKFYPWCYSEHHDSENCDCPDRIKKESLKNQGVILISIPIKVPNFKSPLRLWTIIGTFSIFIPDRFFINRGKEFETVGVVRLENDKLVWEE